MRREQGFTLIELLVAMAMFVFVMASVSTIFTSLLTQFKQQSRMGETQIEGVIGLEILRRDIKHAGFGLPWRMNGATYREAEAEAGGTPWVDRVFNDGPPDNPARGTDVAGASNAPGAIRSDNLGLYNSDVLVLKAANLAINGASQRWTRQGAGDVKRNGPPDDLYDPLSGDAFVSSDRVIVISPGSSDATRRGLVLSNDADPASWRTTYNATAAFAPAPLTSPDINIIYGIKQLPVGGGAVSATDPRMPFNRTEYYIKIPTSPMPNQCAGGTGILYRSELSHATGTHTGTEDPLLDCVADFQVVYTTNIAGVTGVAAEDYTNGLTAAQIRTQIRTVTVYILAQEGQKDPDFTFVPPTYTPAAPANSVRVGPLNSTTLGRDFNFATNGITDWQNYRWKVYTLTVSLENTG
ncbi:MAG: prepilin-type N-terminal cleavage/methylation domain-containing protein [Nitrospirota bacterium]